MNRFVPALALALGLLLSAPLAADSFRITFGGADREVSDWSGNISAQDGGVEITASYHFALDESFDRTGWSCGNQWDGKLQMEPRDAAEFPGTRWKGLVVNVEGESATVVELETRLEPGTHYYYVRVIQADDNMAWASPIWVRFAEPQP